MRLSLAAFLFAGLMAFTARHTFAQTSPMGSDTDAPVLEASLTEPNPLFQVQQPDPPPPTAPVVSQQPLAADDARAKEDSYRATIKSLRQKKRQFVHCKLKNGKIVTGTIADAGFEAFTLHSNILGDGTYIYYKDLAELPRPVAAVGTRFKQGAQWAGFGAVVAVAIPVLVVFSPFFFASGWQC